MCVVSMIMDHYRDKWGPLVPQQPYSIPWAPPPPVPAISPAEVEEFRRLLERAREYDRRHNQPDCGLEEKRRLVREMAEALGVAVDFV